MIKNGIDCSVRISKSSAEQLVKEGYKFVCRYLVPDRYSKWLSPEEAQIISDAGLDILSVYESTASRALSGFVGGQSDAIKALDCANNVKQPKGTAIYFAVDFDVTKSEQLDTIEQYFRGTASILGSSYQVGVYGEYTVMEEMYKRKAAVCFWQTYAWSRGKRSVHTNVYQYRNGQRVAGITADLNNSFGGEGFWNLRADKKTLTKFTDVPAGFWAEGSIKYISDIGLIGGYPDGHFGVGEPITTERLTVILQRFEKHLKGDN